MDPNKIFQEIEKMPEKMRNTFFSAMISTFMAMKQVESEAFEVKALPDKIEMSTQMKQSIASMFLNNDYDNQQVKAYKEKFYNILKEADQIAKDKYSDNYYSNNLSYEGDGLFQKLNENRRNNDQNDTIVLENKISLLNHDYAAKGRKPIYESRIKVGRYSEDSDNFKIELLSDNLYVKKLGKDYDGINYRLSFVINNTAIPRKIRRDEEIGLLIDINSVSFYKDYTNHRYDILKYESYENRDGFYIIHFKARKS